MELVTIKEVSAYLKVKVNTLYSWVNTGTIPFYKLNGLLRFDMGEIEEWVKCSKEDRQRSNNQPVGPKSKLVDIDSIVKKAIAENRPRGYNPSKRETRPKSRSQEGGFDGTL